ncbi:MAG: truncated hemoglobin [Oligoflexales bacterium]
MTENLYDQIGPDFIVKAITSFYDKAFEDPIIGHFFMGKDKAALVQKQIDFASSMLGGPKNYRGRPLAAVHAELPIRPPHFGRRQVLMREVLEDLGLDKDLMESWLLLEQKLKPLILSQNQTCRE